MKTEILKQHLARMAEVNHNRSRQWIRKFYTDTLITETLTTFIMLCWKYDNSELAIYILLSFLNCILFRSWDATRKYSFLGFVHLVIQVYGSSRVFDTTEWNIVSLFCLILVMHNFWIPVCRFAQITTILALVAIFKLLMAACMRCMDTPNENQVQNNQQVLRRMITHIRNRDETCSICLDEFTIGEEIRRLPCNHVFHPGCMERWVAGGHDTCPNCRHNMTEPKPVEPANSEVAVAV